MRRLGPRTRPVTAHSVAYGFHWLQQATADDALHRRKRTRAVSSESKRIAASRGTAPPRAAIIGGLFGYPAHPVNPGQPLNGAPKPIGGRKNAQKAQKKSARQFLRLLRLFVAIQVALLLFLLGAQLV